MVNSVGRCDRQREVLQIGTRRDVVCWAMGASRVRSFVRQCITRFVDRTLPEHDNRMICCSQCKRKRVKSSGESLFVGACVLLNGKYDIVALVVMRDQPYSPIKSSSPSYPSLPKGNAVLFSSFHLSHCLCDDFFQS